MYINIHRACRSRIKIYGSLSHMTKNAVLRRRNGSYTTYTASVDVEAAGSVDFAGSIRKTIVKVMVHLFKLTAGPLSSCVSVRALLGRSNKAIREHLHNKSIRQGRFLSGLGEVLSQISLNATMRFNISLFFCLSITQFHQTVKTYLNDRVWQFYFYVSKNWPEQPICLHFPGCTLTVSGLNYCRHC